MIIEFNEHKSSSVKSIAVKSETNIKCTSRFMSGKPYLFASRTAALLKKKTIIGSIYKKYDIEQIFCYQVLTDTDSTSIQFIFVSDPPNKSDEFWRRFNVQTAQESTF